MPEQLPDADDARPVSPWWGVAAIVIAVAPFAAFPSLVRLPFVIVALALGGWAVVAALKGRLRPERRRASSVLAVVAALAAIILVAATVIGVDAERNRPRVVAIEASGADIMQVNYRADDVDASEIWASGRRTSFLASGTQTSMHVIAQIGFEEAVTCKIYIDNELVLTKSSSTGEVTCRYVHPWR